MLSQDEEKVGLYFVVPSKCKTKDECDPIMLSTFKESEEQELHPQWSSEKKCMEIEADKRMVFVFQEFEGEAFLHLQKSKSVLVGPKCLLTCFEQNMQLPHLPYPFFSMAMNGLAVSASGVGPVVKETLKKKVELMAGIYSSQLISSTTHLIVKAARSEKYEKALKMAVPVMTVDWVDAVWEKNQQGSVLAVDKMFEKYKCPAFQGLLICTSNVSSAEKNRLAGLINSNGGTYDGKLHSKVDILVVGKPEGDKFRYARNWNLPCVKPQWVYDSADQGRALATAAYQVRETNKASTPTKDDLHFQSFADMSVMSNIPLDSRNHIDETMGTTLSETPSGSFKMPLQRPSAIPSTSRPSTFAKPFSVETPTPASAQPLTPKKGPSYKSQLEDLDFEKTKQAGPFLDGCKVYLYGFTSEEEEKLRRVLKGSGASRFTELSESVTHILVGDSDAALSKQLKTLSYRPHVVSFSWLIQSVALGSPAPEDQYSCGGIARNAGPETPSPLSKKGLALLQRGDESPIPLKESNVRPPDGGSTLSSKKSSQLLKELRDPKDVDADLASFYRNESSKPTIPTPKTPADATRPLRDSSDTPHSVETSTVSSQEVNVFHNLKFVLVGLTDEAQNEIERMIKLYGGQIVPRSFKGVPDYAIVPLTGAAVSAATEVVTAFWVEDCMENSSIVEPVEYYHQPVSMHRDKFPLRGCVIGMSGYTGKERKFLCEVASVMGAVTQEVLARKDHIEKKARASTHLVCRAAEGSKFTAARRWKLPVITHGWVMECCRTGAYAPVEPFLVDPTQEVAPFVPAEPSTEVTDQRRSADAPDVKTDRMEENDGQTSSFADSTPKSGRPSASVSDPAERMDLPPGAEGHPSGETPEFTPRTIQRFEAAAMTPKTPETPYGFSKNPSPAERKAWKKWLDKLPAYKPLPEPLKRRNSTPLSELRRQVWAKYGVKTPVTPKPGEENLNEEDEDADSVKRRKCEPSDAKVDTPSGAGSNKVARNILAETVSSAEGQLDEVNQLLQMPVVIAGASSANSTAAGVSTPSSSPVKDKPTKTVPKVYSQPYSIHWEDPAASKTSSAYEKESESAETKRRSLEQVTPKEEPPSEVSACNDEGPAAPEEKTTTHSRVFMLSNVNDRERRIKMLQELGATVIENDGFTKDITHLIVDRPVRSEKLLASIASGKWVLHTSYIVDSYKRKQFLKEEDYEWGSPSNPELKKLVKPGGTEDNLACGAYRWRQKLSGKDEGAFHGMKALMSVMPNKTQSFIRLIEAGGGAVLSASEMEFATHCFIDQNKPVSFDCEMLSKLGVPCLPLLFLQDFLLKDPPPNPADCIVRPRTK